MKASVFPAASAGRSALWKWICWIRPSVERTVRNVSCVWNVSGTARWMRCRRMTQLQVACGRRKADGDSAGGIALGNRSFPKLKIPHQSHADFCSTDTAGGLDNKKRRYAPRGGVAYRLFLWGFPKGATPPFGTRLCEAKCSVLYALPALP